MTIFDSPVAKVLAVLAEVARTREAAASAVADRLQLPVSTVHRIGSELERLGYLQRVPGTRNWMPATRMIGLAVDTLEASLQLAKPQAILRELTERLGEMCTFGVRRGDEVVYLASAEPRREVTLSFRAGRTGPLHCTSSGRLFLARYDDEELARYLEGATLAPCTPFTVTDPARLQEIVRQVRAQGYAVTSQEYVLHIAGAAVPVTGTDGVLYGSLGVSAPEMRTGPERLAGFIPELREAARRLAECFAPQPAVALARSA
jgi:DNA-binding IclR family transcriptional regulator